MKHLLFTLSVLFSFSCFAQIEMSSPATIVMESDSGKQIRATNNNVGVYYNTTTNELRIRLDLSKIVTGDSTMDANFQALTPKRMLFIASINNPDQFFGTHNVDALQMEGTWWYGNNSTTTEAEYMPETFVEEDQSRQRTRLQFNNQLDVRQLKIPVLSALSSYAFSISLPDAYINLVTQF
ncbi:MAG TPA: hypothetical protein VGB95_02745 [Chitinophagales bacterium]